MATIRYYFRVLFDDDYRALTRLEAVRRLLQLPPALLLLFALSGGCAGSPLAPDAVSADAASSASALIQVSDYLIPRGVSRLTGPHRMTISFAFPTLTIDKDGPAETWLQDTAAGWWRHTGDSSAPGQSPYVLLEGSEFARWLPLTASPGYCDTILADIVQDGVRRPFPYVTSVLGLEDGGETLVTEYEPLHADLSRHVSAREQYRFRRGVGLVGWRAVWNGDVWLAYTPLR